jgi:streptogramin lyase
MRLTSTIRSRARSVLQLSPAVCLGVMVASLAWPVAGALAVTHTRSTVVALRLLRPPVDRGRIVVFTLARALPKGSLLSEDAPILPPRGTPPDRVTTRLRGRRLARPAFLYWEDFAYGAHFEHLSRLLLIDARSGAVVLSRYMSWEPLVDGRPPAFLTSPAAYADPRMQVFSNVPRRAGCPYRQPRRCAVVARDATAFASFGPLGRAVPRRIGGSSALPPGSLAHDCLITIGRRDDPLFAGDFAAIEGWAAHVAGAGLRSFPMPPESGGRDLFEKVRALTMLTPSCDDIFIFISGHGAAAPKTFDPVTHKPLHGSVDPYVNTGEKTVTNAKGQLEEERSYIFDFWLKAIIKDFPTTKFKFLMDTCYAGRWAAPLEQSNTAHNLQIVLMSSSATQSSWAHLTDGYPGHATATGIYEFYFGNSIANTTYNPTGAGEFTNGVVGGLYQWSDSQANVQLTGGLLPNGLQLAFTDSVGGDFAHQLGLTNPVSLDHVQPYHMLAPSGVVTTHQMFSSDVGFFAVAYGVAGGPAPTAIDHVSTASLFGSETTPSKVFGSKLPSYVEVPDEVATATPSASPGAITAGPNGNYWFVEPGVNKIGQVTPTGSVSDYPITTADSVPNGITAGSDGALWFTEEGANQIGRMTTAGVVTNEFPLPHANSGPYLIAPGADSALWFTEIGGNRIGRITTGGTITEFDSTNGLSANAGVDAIAQGPDGNMWFTEFNANKIGRITPAGVITEFPVPTAASGPNGIIAGPDGNLWFDEYMGNQFGRITPSGTITEFGGLPANAGPANEMAAAPDGRIYAPIAGSSLAAVTTGK